MRKGGRQKQARGEAESTVLALPPKAVGRKADPLQTHVYSPCPSAPRRQKSTLTLGHSQTHECTQKHTALSQWAAKVPLNCWLG